MVPTVPRPGVRLIAAPVAPAPADWIQTADATSASNAPMRRTRPMLFPRSPMLLLLRGEQHDGLPVVQPSVRHSPRCRLGHQHLVGGQAEGAGRSGRDLADA